MYNIKLNFNYSSQLDQINYLFGYHRSGWAFVMKELLQFQDSSGILCDTYVDRTFHVKKPSCIPYTQPWIGFIHHTFDTNYSKLNNVELFNNLDFIASLPLCKALFVFSTCQKNIWIQKFESIQINIPVFSLIHPTEFVDNMFTLNNFIENNEKKIIQIGAWLRDSFAIYRLNNGKSPIKILAQLPDACAEKSFSIFKFVLKGKNMDSCFKPLNFFNFIKHGPITNYPDNTNEFKKLSPCTVPLLVPCLDVNAFLPTNTLPKNILFRKNCSYVDDPCRDGDSGPCRDGPCRDGDGPCRDGDGDGPCRDVIGDYTRNQYVQGVVGFLEEIDRSVVTLHNLSNSDYDSLLSQNIVYLKLVDSAAVNTLIECIARNTPIVISKLPSIVEILGPDYPLYIHNYSSDVITWKNIQSAHFYLKKLDKTPLTIPFFLNSFQTCLNTIGIPNY